MRATLPSPHASVDREAACAWFLEHAPHFREWPEERFRSWLAHWFDHSAVALVRLDGEIAAGAIGYPCGWQAVGREWNTPDPSGSCFYIEALVVRDPRAVLGFFLALDRQWPHWRRLRFIGRRHGKCRLLRLKVLQQYVRKGLKVCK